MRRPAAALGIALTLVPASAQGPVVEIGLNRLYSDCPPDRPIPALESTWQTLGVARRTDELDRAGLFALVHPVGGCCPKGIAVGLLVRTPDGELPAPNTRLSLQGRLAPLEGSPPLPRHPLRRLELGVLRRHVVFEAHELVSYDALADETRPDVADALDEEAHATFLRALRATGWARTLREPSYFTVLAPTEHAFRGWSAAEQARRFAPEHREALEELVRRHVVASRHTRRSLRGQTAVTTLGGAVAVAGAGRRLMVGGARVLFEDASARNGVVLSVDRLVETTPPDTPTGESNTDRR